MAATTGGDVRAADGYLVVVDSTARGAIGPNGQLFVQFLKEGAHEVSLAGAPARCEVVTTNPLLIPSTKGSIGAANFSVVCGSNSAWIKVSTKTATDARSVGVRHPYTVVLDGDVGQRISGNGSVVFLDLKSGMHTIHLAGPKSNCGGLSFLGSPDYSKTVELQRGEGATVFFTIYCI